MKLKLLLYGLVVLPIYWFRLFLEIFVKDTYPKVIRVRDVDKFNFKKAKFIDDTLIVEVDSLKDAIKFNLRFLNYEVVKGAIYRYENGLMDNREKENMLYRRDLPEKYKRKVRKELADVRKYKD